MDDIDNIPMDALTIFKILGEQDKKALKKW
jgi:hypothetical protein